MDTAILSATSALIGSLIGGMSTLAASWLTLRGRVRAQALVQEAAKREVLDAEFIIEASRRLTEAWSITPRALRLSRVSTPPTNGCALRRQMRSSALPTRSSAS